MALDAQAQVNPGRYLAALAVEELHRQGLGCVVVCPGARNQPLLAAIAARQDLDRVIAVDERAAGHLALGWLRARAAAGAPPALAAVVTTSGSAPLLVAPALAEAEAMALPLVLVSADRPAELHGVGANQTLDQTTPLRPFLRGQADLACHEGGASPRNLLGAVARSARQALGPPAGPVQLNLAFREPLAPDPVDLPEGWSDAVAGWAAGTDPWDTSPAAAPVRPDLTDLRRELAAARRPVVWVAGLEHAADRAAARHLAETTGAPWLADVGSGLRLVPDAARRLDHAEFTWQDLRAADLVLQLGRRPVSLRLGRALSGARRWLVDDHPERQDPWRQGGRHLAVPPTVLADALADKPLVADPDPAWLLKLLTTDAVWRGRLTDRIDHRNDLSEAWLARHLARRLDHRHALLLGNSLAARHVDTLPTADGPSPLTLTSRGTSGIEGLIAQSLGAARSLQRPTVALLGDLTVIHDLGSLTLLARQPAPLLVLAIQNAGGAIFRQLPGGRHESLLNPWLIADQACDLAAVAAACGLAAAQVDDRAALSAALDAFLDDPRPTLIEAVVPPDGHARLMRDLLGEAAP
jgi:2-succinyl-5-enolpyruvyl-6-hydroxy-3-cyclohexene-1-carboxylate synthase